MQRQGLDFVERSREIEIQHDWKRTRSWSARIWKDNTLYHISVRTENPYGHTSSAIIPWKTRGLRRGTVVRRAKKKIRKLKNDTLRQQRSEERMVRLAAESSDRADRFLVED